MKHLSAEQVTEKFGYVRNGKSQLEVAQEMLSKIGGLGIGEGIEIFESEWPTKSESPARILSIVLKSKVTCRAIIEDKKRVGWTIIRITE